MFVFCNCEIYEAYQRVCDTYASLTNRNSKNPHPRNHLGEEEVTEEIQHLLFCFIYVDVKIEQTQTLYCLSKTIRESKEMNSVLKGHFFYRGERRDTRQGAPAI